MAADWSCSRMSRLRFSFGSLLRSNSSYLPPCSLLTMYLYGHENSDVVVQPSWHSTGRTTGHAKVSLYTSRGAVPFARSRPCMVGGTATPVAERIVGATSVKLAKAASVPFTVDFGYFTISTT